MRLLNLCLLVATFFVGNQAYAGLITYSDLDSFEAAVNSPLTYEGFNDNELDYLSVSSGWVRYRTTGSLVTEGEKALTLKEKNSVTFYFEHEIFELGFYLNELNSSNLTYTDSLGNEIVDAFKVTEQWDASTFFGLTTDVGLTSFTLTGSGTTNALYGIDDMRFTASPFSVPEPTSLLMFSLALIVLAANTRRRRK